ncbi:MAG: hypothetical protein MI723_19015, partial [Caulobacterales bacterium]|nr:hypothetical protein [Caulobacterales bacterium]
IAAVVLASAALSVGVALSLPDRFQSFAHLSVLQEESDPLKSEINFELRLDDPVSIESEIKILQTRENYEEVARRLDLAARSDFVTAVRDRGGAAPGGDPAAAGLDAAVKQLHKSVEVVRSGQSRVIEIIVTTRDPILSSGIANGLMDAHIDRQISRRRVELTASLSTLADRRQALEDEVQERERALNDLLREQARLHDRDSEALAPLLQRVESDVVQARIAAEAARAERRAIDAALESGEWPPALAKSPLIEQLEADLTRRRTELAEVAGRYGPNHPQYRAAESTVAEIEEAIARAKESISYSRQAELDIAESRLRSVLRARDEIQDRMQTIALNDVDKAILERERDDAMQILQTVSQRLDKLQEQFEVIRPKVEIVGHATPLYEPAGPSKKLIVAAGTFAGGVFAVILALGLEWTGPLVRRQDHVEAVGGPIVATAPPAPSETPLQDVIVDDPGCEFAESMRTLALTALMRRGNPVEPRGECIVVTSPGEGEGKTTVALSVARALGAEGRRVLLIDGDRFSPSLMEAAGGHAEPDQLPQDYLRTPASIFNADVAESSRRRRLESENESRPNNPFLIGRDKYDMVDIIGASGQDGAAMRSGEFRWHDLVSKSAEHYDVVMIDAPGLFVRSDTFLFVGLADRCLLIARRGHTKKADLRRAYEKLQSFALQSIGTIYNDG